MEITFTPLVERDLPAVKEIYDYYILNTSATFHTDPITLEQLKTFLYIDHPLYASFLIDSDGKPLGYCFLTRFRPRAAYDRTAELTIYLHPDHCGKGIGKKAIFLLEGIARDNGLKNLIASITEENTGSILLFKKCGYIKCAHYVAVGEKFGRVLDVLEYQKQL